VRLAASAGWRSPAADSPRVALKKGAAPAQIALAWLLHRSPVTLPIRGTASLEHLEENVATSGIELSDEYIAALVLTRLLGRLRRYPGMAEAD
jgi:pyridoxine 4-dehydrogenase